MPKTNIVQTDFLAGEISPRMEMQDALEGRKHSAELVQNWHIHLQGTAETSKGWEWIADLPSSYGRLYGFSVSSFTGFMVVITPEKVYITDSTGYIKDNSLIFNGDFEDGSTQWTTTTVGSATIVFLAGVVQLSPGPNPGQLASIKQQIFPAVIGNEHTLTIQFAAGEGPVTLNVGSVEGGSDILSEVIEGISPRVYEGLTTTTTSIWIEVIALGGDAPKAISDIQVYDVTASPDIVEFPSPWDSRSEIAFTQAVMSPSELAMYITSPGVLPQRLFYDEPTSTWSLIPIPFVSPPSEWAIGSAPVAIGFFGGRMWLGGAADDPSVFWGSKSGDFFDFTLGELADDAISHRLNKRGAIRWIVGGQSLLIGTENSEHVISSEGGVIVPGDIFSLVQSSNGSWPAQALEVGNEVIYISPDGRKLRSIGYEWDRDAWRSKDLTYASEHITKDSNTFTHLHYAANPDSVIIGTTLSGNAVTCTYEPFSRTVGFARRTTQGFIVSMSCLPFAGSEELWALVDRKGDGTISLEKEFGGANVKLDSHSHIDSETPIDTFSVPHLAGFTCQVLVDKAVHPDVIPSEPEGNVTLDFAGQEIIIGLKVDSIIKMLPIALRLPNKGTTRTMRTRFIDIWAKVLDSWRPKINGRRTPNRRVPTPMGESEPARTEVFNVSDTGWDQEIQIIIEQDLPLKTELAGVFGRVEQEEI